LIFDSRFYFAAIGTAILSIEDFLQDSICFPRDSIVKSDGNNLEKNYVLFQSDAFALKL